MSTKSLVALERIIGLTSTTNNALSVNETTGEILFAAGATLVVYHPKKNRQKRFYKNEGAVNVKAISSCDVSRDGEWIVGGERGGPDPLAIVWPATEQKDAGKRIRRLRGHKFGIACVRFSPNARYCVTVGVGHDKQIFVWNWRDEEIVGRGSLDENVQSLAFQEAGRWFVTAGTSGSIQFWYLDAKGDVTKKPDGEPRMLTGFSAACLDRFARKDFVDVTCGHGDCAAETYCVTADGTLCCFGQNRMMERWVRLESTRAYAICATNEYIFAACMDGDIRVFEASTFRYVATLPKPASFRDIISKGLRKDHATTSESFPPALCVRLLDGKRLVAVYGDRSMYVWDVRDLSSVGRVRSFVHHCGCIWDVAMFPAHANKERAFQSAFATCSVDGTIRIWTTNHSKKAYQGRSEAWKSKYARSLMCTVCVQERIGCVITRHEDARIASTSHAAEGLRCVDVDPHGDAVAAGDRLGRVHVIRLSASTDQVVQAINAHDAEVLSLSYASSGTDGTVSTFATSSRDRLVHIFRHNRQRDEVRCVHTMDNHSSAVTSVKWDVKGGRLLTSGADQSVVISIRQKGQKDVMTRQHSIKVARGTVYDMDIDVGNKFLVTASQDKRLNIWNVGCAGKPSRVRHYRISTPLGRSPANVLNADNGRCAHRVQLDPSGTFVAACCFDKWIRIFDFYSGQCVACFMGHSELVTGLCWTPDCRRLISVSGDGCIFVWRLRGSMVASMRNRLKEIRGEYPTTNAKTVDSTSASVPVSSEPAGLFGMMLAEANEAVKDAVKPLGGVKMASGEGAVKNVVKPLDERTSTESSRERKLRTKNIVDNATKNRRPSISDLREIQATLMVKKIEPINAKKRDVPTSSKWLDRVKTSGYDLMSESGHRQYHVDKGNKSNASLATLSTEIGDTTSNTSRTYFEDADQDKGQDMSTRVLTAEEVAAKLQDSDVEDDEAEDITSKRTTDDVVHVERSGETAADEDEEDETSVVYQRTDMESAQSKDRFAVTRTSKSDVEVKTEEPLTRNEDEATAPTPPTKPSANTGDDVDTLRTSLSFDFFKKLERQDEATSIVAASHDENHSASMGTTRELLIQRDRTDRNTEIVEKVRTKLQHVGLVRESSPKVFTPPQPPPMSAISKDTPAPSPPTPIRPSRETTSDAMTSFRETLGHVRGAIQTALEQLRELSGSASDSEFVNATARLESLVRSEVAGIHNELGTLRMSRSIQSTTPGQLRVSSDILKSIDSQSSSSSIGVEAILEKYSERLVGMIQRRLLDRREKKLSP